MELKKGNNHALLGARSEKGEKGGRQR